MSKAPTKFEDLDPPFSHLEVRVSGDRYDDFNNALKRWKSAVQKSKILTQYKEKQSYEKPSEKKKRKKREALERARSTAFREALIASGEWEERKRKKEAKRMKRKGDDCGAESGPDDYSL
jgi:small subunit ribosomal protein S21